MSDTETEIESVENVEKEGDRAGMQLRSGTELRQTQGTNLHIEMEMRKMEMEMKFREKRMEMELAEKQRERDHEIHMRTLTIEEERLKMQQNRVSPEVGYPVKLKLQPFDCRSEDIMIEAVAKKAGWTDDKCFTFADSTIGRCQTSSSTNM